MPKFEALKASSYNLNFSIHFGSVVSCVTGAIKIKTNVWKNSNCN